jgi:hypothetical protein
VNRFKLKLEKSRDDMAVETYWNNPERYSQEAFKKGFDYAVQYLFEQPEFQTFLHSLNQDEFRNKQLLEFSESLNKKQETEV